MCGRFVIARELNEIAEAFLVDEYQPASVINYNVAPTTKIPIIVEREIESLPSREIHMARWGLVPSWAKEISGAPLINARVETILEKPSFQDAAKAKRCVVPVSGYFEWSEYFEEKTPFYIHAEGSMLGLAGIYNWWRDPSKDQSDTSRWLLTCSLITKPSAPALSQIHDRNPIFLTEETLDAWLEPNYETSESVLNEIRSQSDLMANELHFHKVDPKVGSIKNNSPELIREI